MLRHLLVLMCLGLFALEGNYASGELVRVQFEAKLRSTIFSRYLPNIRGSFSYDDERIHTNSGLLHDITFVEILDFKFEFEDYGNEYDYEFGSGVFHWAEPRYPNVDGFNFKRQGFSIGTLEYIDSDGPIDLDDIAFAVLEHTGLDIQKGFSKEDLENLDEDQRFFTTIFSLTGMPVVYEPVVSIHLANIETTLSDVLLSGFQNQTFSSMELYQEYPCPNPTGLIHYIPGGPGSNREIEDCRYLVSEYSLMDFQNILSIPEPTSLLLITMFSVGGLFARRYA